MNVLVLMRPFGSYSLDSAKSFFIWSFFPGFLVLPLVDVRIELSLSSFVFSDSFGKADVDS